MDKPTILQHIENKRKLKKLEELKDFLERRLKHSKDGKEKSIICEVQNFIKKNNL